MWNVRLETGKPVIGFVHRDPGRLPASRCELADAGKAKLTIFRDFVQQKMCRFWDSPADIGSQVSRSLVKLIKTHPGIGWVRGNLVPDESATEEILSLRRKIEDLQAKLMAVQSSGPAGSAELAQGTDRYEINFSFVASPDRWEHNGRDYRSTVIVSWDDIFSAVSPIMINEAPEADFVKALNAFVRDCSLADLQNSKGFKGLNLMSFRIDRDDFQTIKIQLRALGLITKSTKTRSVKDTATYWTLTPYGDNVMTRLRAIKRSESELSKPKT